MANDNNFNINPVHLDAQSEGNSFTFTNPISQYQAGAKAYQLAATEGSSFTFTNSKKSGFQYALTITDLAATSDNCLIHESVNVIVTHVATENVLIRESLLSKPALEQELALLKESVQVIVTKTVSDNVHLYELAAPQEYTSSIENRTLLKESVQAIVTNSFADAGLIHEHVKVTTRLTFAYTCYIEGIIRDTIPYTTRIQGATLTNNAYLCNIYGMQYGLVAATVTGVGPLGDSNPMGPLVLTINGSSIWGASASSIPNFGTYTQIPNTGTTINPTWQWRDLFQFGMNLDYSGGTFSLASQQSYGNDQGGSNMTLFGLVATITDPGKRYSNAMKAYTVDGIFGSPLLNKQFKLLQNSSLLINLLGSPQNNVNSLNPLTAKTIANVIAEMCQITLIWASPYDIPVTNFSFEGTMNGITALNSMATRVGCTLRWHGNNVYYIAPPGFTIGAYTVPNQKLITAAGIEEHSHYDLETGIGGAVSINGFGTPVVTLTNYAAAYQNATGQTGTVAIPINGQQALLVAGGPAGLTQPLVPVRDLGNTIITDQDPIIEIALPANYQSVLIRVLVPPQGDQTFIQGDTTAYPAPVTSNSNDWFDFVAPGSLTNSNISNPSNPNAPPISNVGTLGANPEYIYTKFEGGMYKPYIKLDNVYYDFLTNLGVTAINNKHFNLQIACYTRPVGQVVAYNPNIIQQYVQTYRGVINCQFTGVLPLPGMLGSATVDDLTVEGVIESVSLSPPGILQLTVAQYTGIKWSNPYLNITA